MGNLIITGAPENDITSILDESGIAFTSNKDISSALKEAPENSGMMVLAQKPGCLPAGLPADFWKKAAEKNLKIYVECPGFMPGAKSPRKRAIGLERAVIASGALGEELLPLAILNVPASEFLEMEKNEPVIVLARVAGFDRAVFGLPEKDVFSLLGVMPEHNALVSALPLAFFVTGRFSPLREWVLVWEYILKWLCPGLETGGLKAKPSVAPSYHFKEPLPARRLEQALSRGAEWYFNAKMLIDRSWEQEYWKHRPYPGDDVPPRPEWACGDGSLGVMEGFNTKILPGGSQPAMWYRRADCNGVTAGAMALAGKALNEERFINTGINISDFLVYRSLMALGNHSDPEHPAFGLFGWHDRANYSAKQNGFDMHYGDDNANAVLGLLASAAVSGTVRWDRRIMECIAANFRTTGKYGFRPANIQTGSLVEHGWKHFYGSGYTEYSPHFQAYPWACFLWAYRRTGWKNFFERTRTAVKMTMDAYPGNWKWTNGIQQERARMLLPLAWLVRIDDTPEHRGWLERIAEDIISSQDISGALCEELGNPEAGRYGAQKSNAEYGKSESPLIHENGDPVCDLLYTMNYAALGLNEAAHATGEKGYFKALDLMSDFFCRVSASSRAHPRFEGGWYRGFDLKRWEFGGSNSDRCWGAWCMETGWIQGWILMALSLKKLKTSLWSVTGHAMTGLDTEEILDRFFPE